MMGESALVKIYDVSEDAMRPVTPEDISLLQRSVSEHAAFVGTHWWAHGHSEIEQTFRSVGAAYTHRYEITVKVKTPTGFRTFGVTENEDKGHNSPSPQTTALMLRNLADLIDKELSS